MYQHRNWQGELLDYPVGKVVCVGSNYRDHIREMESIVPEEPLLFMKPETALCDIHQAIILPDGSGAVHHELELAILLGQPLCRATEEQISPAIAGYGVALDLTLRDVQARLKKAGQPWEKAKGFDNACPISGFVPVTEFDGDPQNIPLSLHINGTLRQQGTTSAMIHKIVPLIACMSHFFTLKAGDIILTGTPAGVGPLNHGDELVIGFNDLTLTTHVQ
ncbi:fumarylacetoacetate hydrolase family protein [Enterobacteriaceae bacterium ESL0689]|nr:fumarylacetoacetate hydrolase family protein [Enterobacteriaceae bacterium ESL0689]